MSTDADLISSVLDTRESPWFRGTARRLARKQWSAVKHSTGLSRLSYGTMRYLAQNPATRRQEMTTISLPVSFLEDAPVVVENLYGEPLDRYIEIGLNFYAPGMINERLVRSRLDAAFCRLNEIPDAAACVGAVLAALHIIKPAGIEFDSSYSDPLLPFSIFVGVAVGDQVNGDLRLAEGILHECMHLQLTIIEAAVPMVAGFYERYHSPWQQKLRPSQGILHGLYVFRAIQAFYEALYDNGACSANERTYLVRRIKTIEEEVAAIGDFGLSEDLTDAGRRFASALLRPQA